jgi:hypothetical protein
MKPNKIFPDSELTRRAHQDCICGHVFAFHVYMQGDGLWCIGRCDSGSGPAPVGNDCQCRKFELAHARESR